MKMPYFEAAGRRTKKQIIAIAGLNYGRETAEGELLDSTGLSSAQFPCLSQRESRKVQATYKKPTGLYARGKLCVVDSTDFIYGDKVVGQVREGEKLFATINTKIVIFPDKAFFDTATETFGHLDAQYPGYAGNITFTDKSITVPTNSYIDSAPGSTLMLTGVLATEAITAYSGVTVHPTTGVLTLSGATQKTAQTLKNGDFIQRDCDAAKEYMAVQSSALQSDASYQIGYILHRAKLHEYPEFGTIFTAGDAIDISGCTTCPKNNGSHIIRSISGRTLSFHANTFSQVGLENGTLMLERKVPDLSCICECDNRIWGAAGTTIYASALGDPRNFNVYDGLATDSYSVAVGTDGDFTGCIAYSSTVLFWKENCVHKILGSYPAQYEVYTYTVPGLQEGSEKSLCIINETLFYKGRNGVYAYNGGTPVLISACFGTRRFFQAVGGSDGEGYYISMRDESGLWNLFVFDTLRGFWLREDDTRVFDFAQLNGVLHYLDYGSGKVVMTKQGQEELIPWSATLCRFDETVHGRKGYSKLYLRADMGAGAWIKVEVSCDGTPFQQVFISHDERAKTVQIPILPVRCDHFCIRLSGRGLCVIKSIVRAFSIMSEV